MTVTPELPDLISDAEMRKRFQDGPVLNKGWAMVLLGDRLYKRESDGWHLLDNRSNTSVKEMTSDGAGLDG